jgi:hypothetical protein
MTTSINNIRNSPPLRGQTSGIEKNSVVATPTPMESEADIIDALSGALASATKNLAAVKNSPATALNIETTLDQFTECMQPLQQLSPGLETAAGQSLTELFNSIVSNFKDSIAAHSKQIEGDATYAVYLKTSLLEATEKRTEAAKPTDGILSDDYRNANELMTKINQKIDIHQKQCDADQKLLIGFYSKLVVQLRERLAESISG